jgi:hypothetical protein
MSPQSQRGKMMKVLIRSRETDEIIQVIKTEKTGRNFDKFLDGLYRKVDFDKYWVDDSGVEDEPEDLCDLFSEFS